MRFPWPLLLVLLVPTAASAQENAFDLEGLLARSGTFEVERAKLTCRWIETSRLDQLDDDGTVIGSVIRTFQVVSRGPETVSRTKTDEKIEGDPSSLLREERPPRKPDPKDDPRDRLSPLHPDARALYDIELVSRARAVTVSFKPKTPSERRVFGTLTIDPVTGRPMHMTARPSKPVKFVDSFSMELRFAPGPCGNQIQLIEGEGSGGLLFFKARFRTRTELTGHQLVEGP